MSVIVTYSGVGETVPAQSVTSIIATRFHGGDINVVLRVDNNRDYTYLATARFPTISFQLVDIKTIGRVVGPVSVDSTRDPITVTVQRGHVGTPTNKF